MRVLFIYGIVEEHPHLVVEEREMRIAEEDTDPWSLLASAVEEMRTKGYRCRDYWAPNIKRCEKNGDAVLIWLAQEPGGDPITDSEAIPL